MAEVEELLASAREPVSVTAAAGCGKTEAIARAVKLAEGRQLVLTHTNAGVAALRSRLRKLGVSPSQYRVQTIASWFLKYAAAYPSMSGLDNPRPQGADWAKVYPAAELLLGYPFARDVIRASFAGLFVDEYQDCTLPQHRLVTRLAEIQPVRVLGDPLQGIFGFAGAKLDWVSDVESTFRPLSRQLTTRHRWQATNPALGTWLGTVRARLLEGQPIDLASADVITRRPWSYSEEVQACLDAHRSKSGTIAAIHQWPSHAHDVARKTEGQFQSIEEMDCKELMKVTKNLDQIAASSKHTALATVVISFVGRCAHVGDCFREVLDCVRHRSIDGLPGIGDQPLGSAFHRLVAERDLGAVAEIVACVMSSPSVTVYRRELLSEMKNAAIEYSTGVQDTLADAAYAARCRTRARGRRPERRVVSRTLLLKGLEFDHAIVLRAEKLQNKENFYVAVTRGSSSLTVLSRRESVVYTD